MRRCTCLALLLTAAPALVFAQPAAEPNVPPPPPAPPPEAPPPPSLQGSQPAGPSGLSPQRGAGPLGQWVNTNQYGWLWMPYGQRYTYIPGDAQTFPDQYVYYPIYGWRWVVAPWVYGYGPSPYWGASGLSYFAWYAHPWFRVGGYWGWGGFRGWGEYRGWVGPRSWGTRGWAGAPAYYGSGVGGPHPVHAIRSEPARRGAEHERARREHREGER
jgi:hypothetical protein